MAEASVAVRGRASADVDPEVARVAIDISAEGTDRLAAVEALAKADAAVWAVLTDYPGAVEHSRTDGVQVRQEIADPAKRSKKSKKPSAKRAPDLADSKSARQVARFAAQVRYDVTIGDFAVLDQMLSALAGQQGVELAGPSWALRANSAVYVALRTEAVQDARSRAEQYAMAAGATLTGLIELAEPPSSLASENERAPAAEPSAGEQTRPSWVIQPARQSVAVTVEARFSVSQPYFP